MEKIFSNKRARFFFIVFLIIVLLCALGKFAAWWYIEQLPRVQMSPDYPYLTIEELKEKAEYIVYGRVKKIKGRDIVSIWKDKVQWEEKIQGRDRPFDPVMTPIVLEVREVFKGDVKGRNITYYQDGGLKDSAIILPNGAILSEGDEVILFMNSDKEGWGYYGEFPVVDGQVFGLLEEDLASFSNIRTQKAKDIDAPFIQKGLQYEYKGMSPSMEYSSVELREFVEYLK